MTTFKVPQQLPQDLLLISEFVDVPEDNTRTQSQVIEDDYDIASSGSEVESEEEIEKDLTALHEEDQEGDSEMPLSPDSISESESSASESESESKGEENNLVSKPRAPSPSADDDEEMVPAATAYLQTKNEVLDATINIPDLEEVGLDEELEKVGEIFSIIDQIAIVKGQPSEYPNRASERALDSDTLLVFEDHKVMGYIYETFGPTSQPLYQIKFNQSYPLNTDKIWVGREVFHVPRRSHFVFVRQLKQFKGSDASNVHDEEPAENELEFSDDEAEAEYKSRLKRKRGERANSVSSSRRSTPAPSQMRDQDMMLESTSNNTPFNEYGTYQLDYDAGSSRPIPQPYDDPYSDTYNKPEVLATQLQPVDEKYPKPAAPRHRGYSSESRAHGRGRGRGRGKRGNNHPTGSFGRGTHYSSFNDASIDTEGYDPRRPQESLPSPYSPSEGNNPFNYVPDATTPLWSYPNQQQSHIFPGSSFQPPHEQPSTFVQPHINPRFASAFGFRMAANNSAYPQELSSSTSNNSPVTSPSVQAARNWLDQWAVSTINPTAPEEEKPSS